MAYNPFAGVRITGTWEDHASYSAGGTDLPLAYGTPLPAPASGIMRISGGSGEWACGWVGTAGRRSILHLDKPIYRHTPRRSSPFEAEGPMTAVVFQHQSAFGATGWHAEGATVGRSGASASGSDWGGDVHLHWHGLDANGNRLRIESFLPTGTASGGYDPIEEDMTPEQDQLLRNIAGFLYAGGPSASDPNYLGAPDTVYRFLKTPVSRTVDGKVVKIPQIQDNADTNSMVRKLAANGVPVSLDAAALDALATKIVAALPTGSLTKDDVRDVLGEFTFTVDAGDEG